MCEFVSVRLSLTASKSSALNETARLLDGVTLASMTSPRLHQKQHCNMRNITNVV